MAVSLVLGLACGDAGSGACPDLGCMCTADEACGPGLHCYSGKCLPEAGTGEGESGPPPTTGSGATGGGPGDSGGGSDATGDMTAGPGEPVSLCHQLDQQVLGGYMGNFSDTIEVASGAAIGAVRVEVVVRTPDVGSVFMSIAGAERIVSLFEANQCTGGVDFDATFDGAAAQAPWEQCPDGEGVTGAVKPGEDLAEFVGRAAGGGWTLDVRSDGSDKDFVVERWCVHIDTVAGAPDTEQVGGDARWIRPQALGDPGGRIFAAWAYDADREVVVVFGGCPSLPNYGYDCWYNYFDLEMTLEWDGATWTFVDIPHPGGNFTISHLGAMVHDPVRHEIVLFGGLRETGGDPLDETWTYDGAAWTQLAPQVVPSARTGHSLVWDPVRAQALLFGGQSYFDVIPVKSDVWAWDGATWAQLAGAGGPGPRYMHSATWHAGLGRMLIHGGFAEKGYPDEGALGDLWSYDPGSGAWQDLGDTPLHTASGTMVHDPLRDRVVLFAGRVIAGEYNRYEWDGATWTGFHGPTKDPYLPRYGHGMVWDAARAGAFMYGGMADATNATWYYAPVP